MKKVSISEDFSIIVDSTFSDAIDLFSYGLEKEFKGLSCGNIWVIVEVIIKSGIVWKGWDIYYNNLRNEYLTLLKGKPEYKDGEWSTQKEKKAAMWFYNELAFSIASKHYLPDEVPMPTFIEGEVANPSIFREMAEKNNISIDIIYDYFLKSFSSFQFIDKYNINYQPSTWKALKKMGMIFQGKEIPTYSAVDNLSFAETKVLIKTLGEKPNRTFNENIKLLKTLIIQDEIFVKSAINKIRDWDKTFFVSPPENIDWIQFQCVRQQIKGMAVAIGDIFFDDIRKKYPKDYIRLTNL